LTSSNKSLTSQSLAICSAIELAASSAETRSDLWVRIVSSLDIATCAEIGVYKGHFSKDILSGCPRIKQYYLLDPWTHLDEWNKPLNKSAGEFSEVKSEALANTEFAAEKRIVLEGTTKDVSCSLPDNGIDFVYIDGDHTLRGITIDLIHTYPKVRRCGILAGDDFSTRVWQHGREYEPTMVFPGVLHFAEAIGATIYGLPFEQFAIVIDDGMSGEFVFRDLTGKYPSPSLLGLLNHDDVIPSLFQRLVARIR
jgi:hypothetical protein